MRKILLSVLAVLVMSGMSFASSFELSGLGVSVKGVISGSDTNIDVKFDEMFNDFWSSVGGSKFGGTNHVKPSAMAFGIDVFYETNKLFDLGEKNLFGVKIGYEGVNEGENTVYYGIPTIVGSFSNNTTYYDGYEYYAKTSGFIIPISAYYKKDVSSKFKYFAGFGFDIINAKLAVTSYDIGGSETFVNYVSESGGMVKTAIQEKEYSALVISPKVNFGIEWRFMKYAGLFLDAGFNLAGKAVFKDTVQNGDDLYRDFSGFKMGMGINIYPF
ncbi:MAG: hypothetical protein FWF00_05845 [Endomicrobia bacterium]|nr:hypothetical protein [Endomicrobiia bacterium]MCL2507188.1 hypothetical protein [Endomicrobiia bacterium]